jgi:hypothetical protein
MAGAVESNQLSFMHRVWVPSLPRMSAIHALCQAPYPSSATAIRSASPVQPGESQLEDPPASGGHSFRRYGPGRRALGFAHNLVGPIDGLESALSSRLIGACWRH